MIGQKHSRKMVLINLYQYKDGPMYGVEDHPIDSRKEVRTPILESLITNIESREEWQINYSVIDYFHLPKEFLLDWARAKGLDPNLGQSALEALKRERASELGLHPDISANYLMLMEEAVSFGYAGEEVPLPDEIFALKKSFYGLSTLSDEEVKLFFFFTDNWDAVNKITPLNCDSLNLMRR